MELQQLQSFVTVAEQASFTRAAQVLGMAQPALSRHIRSLEVELRQTLLTRNGRGAVTTDAGKLLLEHARGILHQVAVAREELGAVRGALAGRQGNQCGPVASLAGRFGAAVPALGRRHGPGTRRRIAKRRHPVCAVPDS